MAIVICSVSARMRSDEREMAWDGRCGGLMIAIFDDAARGDERAVEQALAVCDVCPIRRRCREQVLDAAPWPEGHGPRGVVAGVVVGLRGRPRLDRLQVGVAA